LPLPPLISLLPGTGTHRASEGTAPTAYRPSQPGLPAPLTTPLATAPLLRCQATGNRTLIYGNTYGENFWGTASDDHGKGQNRLGQLLDKVRVL